MNYILALKTEPDLCGISCPCAVDYGTDLSEEDLREIDADSRFERTYMDASSDQEGDA